MGGAINYILFSLGPPGSDGLVGPRGISGENKKNTAQHAIFGGWGVQLMIYSFFFVHMIISIALYCKLEFAIARRHVLLLLLLTYSIGAYIPVFFVFFED